MIEWYRLVMDSDRNPLRRLPRVQRFQVMVVLSLMWTAIFCTMAGVWFLYEELFALHLLFATGVLLTGATFHGANRLGSYREQTRVDGTPRYDDVWGAS